MALSHLDYEKLYRTRYFHEWQQKIESLNIIKKDLLENEAEDSIYDVCGYADDETLRPDYDYTALQAEISEIDGKARKLRHSLNRYISGTYVEEYDMYLDELLEHAALMCMRVKKLSAFEHRPKRRLVKNCIINGEKSLYMNIPPWEQKKWLSTTMDLIGLIRRLLRLSYATPEKQKGSDAMKLTPAKAIKMYRSIQDEYYDILRKEGKTSTFLAAQGEDPEALRPVYDYDETTRQLEALECKMRRLKHAVFTFNMTTQVPGYDMTIDEMLIYIPQLNSRKKKLKEMAERLPRERANSNYYGDNKFIDYTYTNYDVEQANRDYMDTARKLAEAQTALDEINSTLELEIAL